MTKKLSVLAIAILTLGVVLVGCGDNSGAGASNDQSAGNTAPSNPTGDGKPATGGGRGEQAPAPTPGPQ